VEGLVPPILSSTLRKKARRFEVFGDASAAFGRRHSEAVEAG
jgi:hypothetical protein